MTGTVVMLTSLIEFPVTINVGGSNMGSVTCICLPQCNFLVDNGIVYP